MAFLTSFLTRADVIVYFAVFLLLLIYWLNRSKKSREKMPPGPTPLPFIGNLHQLDLNNTHQSLMEMYEKYGEIFTLHFGPRKVVVIAGYKAVKEALITRGDDFVDRPSSPLTDLATNNHGILFSSGEEWKSMRRFILSTLRDFGMGKKSLEGKIHEEIIALIEIFKSYNGKAFNPTLKVTSAVSNVICSIIFGKRFEDDDPSFQKLIRMLDENAKITGEPKVLLFTFYPFIGRLLGLHKKVMQNVEKLNDFIITCVKKRRQEFNANDITGFIDAYLLKQEQESTKPDTYFSDENLYHSVSDLFEAGSETTSTTIRWGILVMMKYPEIQKKIQDEIKMHINPGQLPTLEDRKKMPYTDAVIHELQRFGNILPMNLPHAPPTDVYFRGYCIPKGTEVIPFLTSVLNDKTQWETPYDFNPNHFLDKDAKFVRNDAFMPFSAGRRACAGESLAKMELFLFFTGLLQAFTFYPPPGVSREDLTLKPSVGFTLAPTTYMTCAKLNQ